MTDSLSDPLEVMRAATVLSESFYDDDRRQAIGEAALFAVMGIDPDRVAEGREEPKGNSDRRGTTHE